MKQRTWYINVVLPCAVMVLAGLTGCSPRPDSLAEQVTIYRDEYGVPHVFGETEQAAFFGYGYAQAQDHLKDMMLQYMDAQGRRAEVLGIEALGEGYLRFVPYDYRWDGDYLQRLLKTKKTVMEKKSEIRPEVYAVLDGFARGVNQYITEHRKEIPTWIESITAEDVEALERCQYFRFYSVHDALSKMSEQPYVFPPAWLEPICHLEGKVGERAGHARGTHSHALEQPLSELRRPSGRSRSIECRRNKLVRQSLLPGRVQRQDHLVGHLQCAQHGGCLRGDAQSRKSPAVSL